MATIEKIETAAESGSPCDSIVLSGVSWELYDALREIEDNWHVKMTYDRGQLEMMSPSGMHEQFHKRIGRLIETLTEELDIPILSLAATTWKRKQQEFALEADECYFIKMEPQVRDLLEIDGSQGLPPDLAIEVEVSRKAIGKLPLYALLGVAEVWRYDGVGLHAFRLTADGKYVECAMSVNLPFLKVEELSKFVPRRPGVSETAWIRRYRDRVRETFGDKQVP
jgi:Uma2 family endonuclease